MGLKFAGRTDSRGARFLRGAPVGRGLNPRPAYSQSAICAGASCGIAALCFLIAVFRHALGASPQVAFWPILFSLPVIAARLAQHSALSSATELAIGVLLIGAIWHYAAKFFNRRAPDAVLLAIIAFQLFFLARYCGSFLPLAAPISFGALARPQKLNAVLQIVFLLICALWSTAPLPSSGYGSGVPSRVTSFLKKRRMPARIAGMGVAIFAIIAIYLFSRAGFEIHSLGASTFFALKPPLIFLSWLALDGLYLVGRALWQRVH